jgi:predicted DNA-binding transcriptional regulator AlpA
MAPSIQRQPDPPVPVRRCINTRAAAAYLGVTIAALRAWRLRGPEDRNSGPRFIRLSPSMVVYDLGDLDDWLERKRAATYVNALRGN